MNNFLKTSALLLALGFSATTYGQVAKIRTPKADDGESIIIRKKSTNTDKLTIVVDGDKITINGKPVDDYKSDGVTVLKQKGWGSSNYAYSLAPAIAQSGSWDMYQNNFGKEIKTNKAILGVMTEKTAEGAKITDVTDESAADKAGLKEGDIITKVGEDKIEDADDLYKAVGKYKPEDKVSITYLRDGKSATVTATLLKNKEIKFYGFNGADNFNLSVAPSLNGYAFYRGKPRMGVQVQDTEDGKGVKVLDVDDETPADKAGLKEDDIITSIDGKNITSVDDLKAAIKDGKEGDTFKVTYSRGSDSKTVDVHYPKQLKTGNL